MVPGMVILWFGAIVDIPPLWQLCDGTNGSPNLRDRFVLGAGLTYNPDDNGGNVLHNHAFTGDSHTHTFGFGEDLDAGVLISTILPLKSAVGDTDNGSSLPPYHALAYLWRL